MYRTSHIGCFITYQNQGEVFLPSATYAPNRLSSMSIFLLATPSSSTIYLLMIAILIIALAVAVVLLFLNIRRSKQLTAELQQLDKGKDFLVDQIQQLKKDLESSQAEYNHLFKVNAMNLVELEKAKKDIVEAKRIAEEADMLKSNFLANMSHEIRTPMNGILGFAQLLKDDELDGEMQHRYLDIVCHNGAMLVNLIDDIMDISKIEAGQLAFNKSDVNIDDLFFDLYTFFNEAKFKQEKEHLTLRLLNLNDDENNLLFTDEQRLRQVLSNLIGNAIKFTDKGAVEFGYVNNKEKKHIEFFVRDTGIGIPKEKVDIIFERFRQIEEGSTRKYGGTGIGLFISKHIVDLLGGDIWVESETGKGSTFYFTLPYATVYERENAVKVFTPADKNYNWEGKTIMIAEDAETNYKFLRAMLEKTKAYIIWARNGEEVVSYCHNNSNVDMILMDIQMPVMDGYEATSIIKRQNPSIKIIAQTAYAMPNDNIKCIEAGCNDYISKPINTQLLLEKIDIQLQNSKLNVH
ncbi:ATP-binding protein [Perlabentimonas gracilis]|uniref:ATP-binding protein n=1 Tax=Perlabentimonas gracilis TaxID=2715279 RepID=UPI001408C95D|nr:ATP-binding protein [Perlabentimonas gracilis]